MLFQESFVHKCAHVDQPSLARVFGHISRLGEENDIGRLIGPNEIAEGIEDTLSMTDELDVDARPLFKLPHRFTVLIIIW